MACFQRFFIFSLIFSSFLLTAQAYASKNKSHFEGWYMRLSDKQNQRSFAVVAGSFMKMRGRHLPNRDFPGYLAVILSDNKSGKTKVYESFPQDTTYTTNGQARFGTHQLTGNSTFRWKSKSLGILSNDEIDISIPGVIELQAKIGARLPWQQDRDHLGPEGMILNVPYVPAHWFVHSLGSNTNYQITLAENNEDSSIEGSGYLHQEKNWGTAFPTAWIWSQGVGPKNKTQFALAGGEVKMPMMKMFRSWLIGVRGKVVNWDFRKSRLLTKFQTIIDPCNGKFQLTATNKRRSVVINAQAPVKSFGKVSIPTVTGFKKDRGIESFFANVEIKAYLKKRKKKILQETLNFKNAALEFGAGYMCDKKAR